MEQARHIQTDLDKLLSCYDISRVAEYLYRKGFLLENEIQCIKSLKTRGGIVYYLNQLLSKDSNRFDAFLEEFDVFVSEHHSTVLNQILELKKQKRLRPRSVSREGTKADNGRRSQSRGSTSPHPAGVKEKPWVRAESTPSHLSDPHLSINEMFDHINFSGSQDTGFQSSCYPSLFSVSSDFPDSTTAGETTDQRSQSSQTTQSHDPESLTSSNSTSVVSISHNTIIVNPKQGLFLHPWPLSFPPQPIQATPKTPSTLVHKTVYCREYHHDRKTSEFEELLKRHNRELTKSLNINSLLPFLQREQLLTSNEFDSLLNSHRTNFEKNQLLLSILPSKGERAYERFLRCLSQDTEHSGHADLVKLLTRYEQASNIESVV